MIKNNVCKKPLLADVIKIENVNDGLFQKSWQNICENIEIPSDPGVLSNSILELLQG